MKMVDFSNLTVFNMAGRNMQYLSAKQRVIAQNIANASTPGYLAKTIEEPAFLNNVNSGNITSIVGLRTTHAKHFDTLKSVSDSKSRGGYKVYTATPKDALTIDGNGVIVEDQINEASKASNEYKKMITIYNKYKNMMSVANTKING